MCSSNVRGWNPSDEPAWTSIKPDFTAIPAFEACKGNSSPLLFSLFTHLLPCFIWLSRGMKCWDITHSWPFSQEPGSMFPSRGFAAPSTRFGQAAGRGWGGSPHLSCRGSASARASSSSVLWQDCWKCFWSLTTRECDVLLALQLQPLRQFVSWEKWSAHGFAVTLQLPMKARLRTRKGFCCKSISVVPSTKITWWMKPDEQRCGQVAQRNHLGSSCPWIFRYTWLILTVSRTLNWICPSTIQQGLQSHGMGLKLVGIRK